MKRLLFALLFAVFTAAAVSAESVITLYPDVTEVEACICDAQPVTFTASVTEPGDYSFVKTGDDYGSITMPIAPPEWGFPDSEKDFSSFVTPSCFISVGDYDLKVAAEGPSTDYFDLVVHVSPCVSMEDLNPSKSMCFGQTKTYQIRLKNDSRTADKNYTLFFSGAASKAVDAPTQVFVPSEGEAITEFSVDSTLLEVGEHELEIRAVAIYSLTGQPTEDEASLEMVFDVNDCQSVSIGVEEIDKCFEDPKTVPVTFTNNGPITEELSLDTNSVHASFAQSSLELLPGVSKTVQLTLSQEFDAESVELIADSAIGSRMAREVQVRSEDCYSILIDGPANESSCSDWRSTFEFVVTNDGDADTFNAETDMAFSSVSPSSFELAHGESRSVKLIVAPGLEDGAYDAKLTVSSSKAEAEHEATLNFERCYRVRLAAEPYFVCQCEDKAFPVDILNVGSHPDEYVVGLTDGQEWLLFDNKTVRVSGNSRATVNPNVFTCDAEPGEYSAILNVISTTQNNSERSSKVCINYTMLSKAECYTAIIEASDGEYVECKSSLVPFNVTNSGPVKNAFSLKVEGPKWVNVNPEILKLKPHERGQSYLVISPPLNTVGQEFDVKIRAISKGVATEKTVKLKIGAVTEPQDAEWYAQMSHYNNTLNVSAPKGAIASVLDPAGNVTRYRLEQGFVLLGAEDGEWLVSVEYGGETQTLSYVVGEEPGAQTGFFTASNGALYAGALVLLAVLLVAAYSKTRK